MTLDIDTVLAAWELAGPWAVDATSGGTNNLTLRVTGDAGSFILKRYAGLADSGRIDAEHALLTFLAGTGLSFAVPAPIPTGSGATVIAAGNDVPDVFALFPLIPGTTPNRSNPGEVTSCGSALGELHLALAGMPDSLASASEGGFPRTSPSFSDVTAALEAIDIAYDQRVRIGVIVEDLEAVRAVLATSLPRQVIHADFTVGNVLMEDGVVTAILDFEFASVGFRALDVACGLWSFALGLRDQRDPWPEIGLFLRGYQEQQPMAGDEVRALPDLVLIREATSLRHWSERYRQGLTTNSDLVRRVANLVNLAGWIEQHRDRLVASA